MSKIKLVAALVTILSPTLYADELQEIEKIEVRGELLPTLVDEAANAVSLVDQEAIKQLGAAHLQDVLSQLGNVNFSNGASRARFIQIRGIGERSQFVDPVNPSVGLSIDGIDYSDIGHAATLFDIRQVEVYKGPQGTNVGANAMAGFINLVSAPAGSSEPTRISLEAGNYGLTNFAAATGGDIGEHHKYRVSINKLDGDGYIKNTYLNPAYERAEVEFIEPTQSSADFLTRDDTNGFDELAFRGQLQSRINKDWIVQSVIHKFDIDNGYDAFSLDNTRTTYSDEPGFDRQDTTSFGVKSFYRGLDQFNQKTSFSMSTSELEYGYDEDWAYVGMHPWEYSSTDVYLRDRDNVQLDIAFSGKQDDWVVGLYHQQKDVSFRRAYTYLDSDFVSDYDVSNWALYGEKRFQASKELLISAGARIENYAGDYADSNAINRDTDDLMWGGHLSAINTYNKNLTVYARLSRGFKAGGVNGEALGRLDDPSLEGLDLPLLQNASFSPEVLHNIEMGIRANNSKRDLRFSANLFYATREDMQVKQFLTNEISEDDPDPQPVFVGYISNAGQGVNYGVETTIEYQPNPDVTLNAMFAYLETELEDVKRLGTDPETGEEILVEIDGRDQAHAPGYQFSVGGEWRLTDRIIATVNVTGKDEFFYSVSHDETSKEVTLLNASVTYLADYFDLTLWARNITDEEYGVRGFYFGNDPRDYYDAKAYEQLGEPAVFGVRVDMAF